MLQVLASSACLNSTTDCPGIFCQRCIRLIDQCLCPEYLPDRGEACMLGRKLQTCLACNSREHISRSCPGLQRCSSCNLLGHITCRGGWIGPAYYWRPKTFKLTTPPLVERKDIGCQGGRRDKHGNNQGLLWKVKQKIPCSDDVSFPHCLTLRIPPPIAAVNSTALGAQSDSVSPVSSASSFSSAPASPSPRPESSKNPTGIAMANFPVGLFAFTPVGSHIERGPDHRLQRSTMVVDEAPLNHERYALIEITTCSRSSEKILARRSLSDY